MSLPPQGPPPGWQPYGQPPGWPPPAPQPSPGWQPQGPPPHWSQPAGQPWQWAPTGPPAPPPKKNSPLVLLIVGAVVLLVVAFIGLRILGGGDDEPVSDEQRQANAKTATSASDFDIVCKNGSVSNAGAYTKPYNSLAFNEGEREGSWESTTLEGARGSSELDSINVVACLTRAEGTEVKSGTCEFNSGGEEVSVDHYAVEYDIELHEAKTGKSIKNLGTVNGPADSCPFMAFFDKRSPKLYGAPDGAALNQKLEEFEGS